MTHADVVARAKQTVAEQVSFAQVTWNYFRDNPHTDSDFNREQAQLNVNSWLTHQDEFKEHEPNYGHECPTCAHTCESCGFGAYAPSPCDFIVQKAKSILGITG